MHYRSVLDLNRTIQQRLNAVPADIDLVVGIPRSGLLPANLLSLALNLPLADIDGFCANRILSMGKTRRQSANPDPSAYKRVLVVDDSIATGGAMRAARERLTALPGDPNRFVFCAVYGTEGQNPDADLVLERVPFPRVFEWNLMHHPMLERCCFDIDGVLCHDPDATQNDDGPLYAQFLSTAKQLYVPGFRIGHLVTSRLERYRPETEAWLAAKGIEYGKLWMLDLPTAEERRKLGGHARFKAKVYAQVEAGLFVESEDRQAMEIARLSGKPVLSIEAQTMVYPDSVLQHAANGQLQAARRDDRRRLERRGWRRAVKRTLRQVLPPARFNQLFNWYEVARRR